MAKEIPNFEDAELKSAKKSTKKVEATEKKQSLEVITGQQLDDWKAKYGKIFRTTVGDEVFIWRKIKRKEYVEAMTTQSKNAEARIYDRQDIVAKTCILWPSNIESLIEENGGIAGTLADEILLESGFGIAKTEEL